MAALAVAGGEGSVLLSAEPAHAGTEVTHSAEAKSPAGYLSQLNGEMQSLAIAIKTAQGGVHGENGLTGGTSYDLYRFNQKDPKLMDKLTLTVNQKGQNEIDGINVSLGLNSSSDGSGQEVFYSLNYGVNSDGSQNHKIIGLATSGPGVKHPVLYRVSSIKNLPAEHLLKGEQTINYDQDPSAVAAGVNTFTKLANSIIKSHLNLKQK